MGQSPILMKSGINSSVMAGIADFDEIWQECSSTRIYFLSAMVDVEGVKIILKVGGAKHSLSSILEIVEDLYTRIIEDTVFV